MLLADKNYREITFKAFFWSFVDKISQQSIQFIFSIILARYLIPSDFGVFSILFVVIGIFQILIDFGLGTAIIKNQEVTFLDECSTFYFNIFIGVFCFIFLYTFSSLLVEFFEIQEQRILVSTVSIVFLIYPFCLLPTALLSKSLNFTIQFKVNLFSTILSGLLAILTAFNGFGIWSLAIQVIFLNFYRLLFLFLFSSWRPSFKFSIRSLSKLISFGSFLTFANLLNYLSDNLFLLIIGKVFSLNILGYYACARMIQQAPTRSVITLVERVILPLFSHLQNDKRLLKEYLSETNKNLVFICFPLMTGLYAISYPLIAFLLTKKWIFCVPYLKLLCILGMILPLHMVNITLLKSIGQAKIYLKIEFFRIIFYVVSILISIKYGIFTLIYCQIFVCMMLYIITAYYIKIFLNYKIKNQILDILPYLIISVFMGIIIQKVEISFNYQFLLISSKILFAILIYILMCAFFSLSAFRTYFNYLFYYFK